VGPALIILEVRSIARGYVVLDAMAKRATVEVLHAEPISPGKFWIALRGGEAELEEALVAGLDAAGPSLLDHTFLAAAHESLTAALCSGRRTLGALGPIGVLELSTLASAVRAADAALKAAAVRLVELHLARGIGGKGTVVLTGALGDVEAALDAGGEAAGAACLAGREVLANPDEAVHASAGAGRGGARPGPW
jgi:microcompartment protein CcmL/EutN